MKEALTSSLAPSDSNLRCSFLAAALYLMYLLSPMPKTAIRMPASESEAKPLKKHIRE